MEQPGSLTSNTNATCDGLTPTLLQRHTRRTHTRGTIQVSRGHQAAQTEGHAHITGPRLRLGNRGTGSF